MINQKYYTDIEQFPSQFLCQRAVEVLKKSYDRVIVCGMGGSSSWIPVVNDLLIDQGVTFQIEAWRGYGTPPVDAEKTLFVVCSYSGNTEEVLDAHDHIVETGADYAVITAGGQLLQRAQEAGVATYYIQAQGMQPRLCTGYFISAMSHLLVGLGIVNESLVGGARSFALSHESLSERAKEILATLPETFVPIVYTDQLIGSMARICKIKRNENAKTPAFAGVVPEMCHNEFAGWMSKTMEPTIMLIDHGLIHPRNRKRMEVMKKLLEADGYRVYVLRLESQSVMHLMIEMSMLTDYMTYWYSDAKGIDPEPVKIIEDFKMMLKE